MLKSQLEDLYEPLLLVSVQFLFFYFSLEHVYLNLLIHQLFSEYFTIQQGS